MSKEVPRYTSIQKTPARYATRVDAGIRAAATKWQLTLDVGESKYIEFAFLGKATTRFGNRPMAESTKYSYECAFRQFWRFLSYKGDYESMLLLLVKPPKNAPAIRVDSAEEFLRFKFDTINSPLYEELFRGSVPINDVFGDAMSADGGWNAPKIALIFQAALSDLHIANNNIGQFHDVCDDCLALSREDRHKGCHHHAGRPRFMRTGSPVKHQRFLSTVANIENRAKGLNYKEMGCTQLLPSDLRLLRNRLLSVPSLENLQFWVIIIVACKLFLRHDEFHDIDLDKFIPALFDIPSDRVNSLAVEVFGKCDKEWLTVMLHADNLYTELCPLRPLMVYMHLLGIKGGFLFPSASELKNPPKDGIFKTTICYATFMRQLKGLCEETLPPRPNFKVGAQTFRKTGYLLAVFGDAQDHALMKSARHKTVKNSLTYRREADALYEKHKNGGNPLNNACKWQAIHVDDGGGNSSLMSAYGGSKFVLAKDLGNFFVQDLLGIEKTNPMSKDCIFLMNAAVQYVGPVTPAEAFNELIKGFHPEKQSDIRKVVEAMLCARLKALQQNQAHALVATLPVSIAGSASAATDDAPVQAPPSKKQRSIPDSDLSKRHSLGDAPSKDKLKIMKDMWEMKQYWPKLTCGAKTFKVKFLTPVMNCLEKHFAGDEAAFLETYPTWNHTTFPTKCCDGKDETLCHPKE